MTRKQKKAGGKKGAEVRRAEAEKQAGSRLLALPNILLTVILLLAAGVRIAGIGERGLWLDEAASWLFASASPAALIEALRLDSGPPLYYLLLHGWQGLVGSGAGALRWLSLLFGLGAVAAVYLAGRHLFGQRTALTAALLVALAPIQVRYAQEARAYTLLALLGLAAMYGLLRWVELGAVEKTDGEGNRRKGRGWLVAHAAAFAALLYTHNYGLFLFAAGGLYAVLAGLRAEDRARRSLRHLAGLGIAALLYLPWVPLFLTQLRNQGPIAWMADVWQEHGALGSLWASLAALSPGGGAPVYTDLPSTDWGGFATLVTGLVFVWGGFRLARWRKFGPGPRAEGGLAPRSSTLWLACYLLVPLLLALVYSAARSPIYLPGRLDQLVAPAFFLVLAVGIEGVRPAAGGSALRGILLGLFALAGLAAVSQMRALPAPGGEVEMAREIVARAETAETGRQPPVVIANALLWAPLRHAVHVADPEGRIEVIPFPGEMVDHPGNADPDGMPSPEALRGEARTLVSSLAPASGEPPRQLFLAVAPEVSGAALLTVLSDRAGGLRVRQTYGQRVIDWPVELFEVEIR